MIVIIDNDKASLEIISGVLSAAGHSVEGYDNGKAVLEKGFMLPDLFLLGNTTPPIECMALCKYLRLQADMKKIPVIIIGDEEDKQKAVRAGADLFLSKPFCIHGLLVQVTAALKLCEDSKQFVE